jgi:hypothetical protein
MKKIGTVALIAIMLSSIIAVGYAAPKPETAEGEEVGLLYGCGSPTTSSFYVVHARINDLASEVQDVNSTMVNVAGSVAGAVEMYKGNLDWGGAGGLIIWYESLKGIGKFEGNKQENTLRVLFLTLDMLAPVCVRKDASIDSIQDLEGKKFSWGYPGSTTQIITERSLTALGVEIDPFVGSLSDTVAAIKDRRAVGYTKSVNGHNLDASMKDIQTSTAITFVGFTEEEVNKVQKKYPYITFKKLPAGWFKELPDLGDIYSLYIPLVTMARMDMSEDVAYTITKHIIENWQQLVDLYSGMSNVDPLDTPKVCASMDKVYLHPGSLRYFREQGVEIPSSVVPPEMK